MTDVSKRLRLVGNRRPKVHLSGDRISALLNAMLLHTEEAIPQVSKDYSSLMELSGGLRGSKGQPLEIMQNSYNSQEERLFEMQRIYVASSQENIHCNRTAALFLQAEQSEKLDLEDIGAEKILENFTEPVCEVLDLSDTSGEQAEAAALVYGNMPEAEQHIVAVNSLCDKATHSESINYTKNLTFRKFPSELPDVVPLDAFSSKNFLSFFTKPWSGAIMVFIYVCTLVSEVMIAALNAEKLLGFPPGIKSYLFAAFLVGVSYCLSFFLFQTVESLLTKKKVNWILRTYVVFILVLIGCYSTLSYYRLQDEKKQDQLISLTMEKNDLYDALDFAETPEDEIIYLDLIEEKDQEIKALNESLNSEHSDWQKALSQIALLLTGILTVVTGAILLSAAKIVGKIVSVTKRAKRSKHRTELAQMEYQKIYSKLQRAKSLMRTLVYLEYKRAVLKQLIALNFTDPKSYIKVVDTGDSSSFDFGDVIPPPMN